MSRFKWKAQVSVQLVTTVIIVLVESSTAIRLSIYYRICSCSSNSYNSNNDNSNVVIVTNIIEKQYKLLKKFLSFIVEMLDRIGNDTRILLMF